LHRRQVSFRSDYTSLEFYFNAKRIELLGSNWQTQQTTNSEVSKFQCGVKAFADPGPCSCSGFRSVQFLAGLQQLLLTIRFS
jgi:hypothetical protein